MGLRKILDALKKNMSAPCQACSLVTVLTSQAWLLYVKALQIVLACGAFILVTGNHCSLFTPKLETERYTNILEQLQHRMWLTLRSQS